jgi:hypothetical protein
VKGLRNDRVHTPREDYVVVLPADFNSLLNDDDKVPDHAHAWLYQYELNDADIFTYNIGYSHKLERVIIPVYENNKLIAWQGRDIYYRRNKELFKKGILKKPPLKYYTEYNPYSSVYNNNINNTKLYYNIYNKNSNNLIIVEDILSAIKVFNKFKYNVKALLNSTLTDNSIQTLNLHKYDTTYLWIDYDMRIKSLKYSRKVQSLGHKCKSIRTILDPKAVPYKEMIL